MTLCENCRGQMVIKRVLVDFDTSEGGEHHPWCAVQYPGNGESACDCNRAAEEFEFEACPRCKVVFVDLDGWSVGGNGR